MKTSKKNWNKESNESGKSAQDRALDRFAEMMIEKIENIASDWSKPWFTKGVCKDWPRNLDGRHYNGMNSLMLLLYCEQAGFKYPIFCTFDKAMSLNFTQTKDGMKPCTDKEGNKLPTVAIKKGEKSFPVFLTCFTVVNKEDGSKIKYDDYKKLSNEDKEKFNVFPKLQVYNVFNIDQTNMKEARPDIYEKKIKDIAVAEPVINENMTHFTAMDNMIENNLWICPIKPTYGDQAYYSMSKDEIVIPEFKQFKDGESFYSNLFHEMAHSTGAKQHLDRLKPSAFGSADYAREELVAELTAAMTAQYYGLDKHIKDDSAAYLKSWLDSLKKDASYIKTVLMDVKRASAMLTFKIDEVNQPLAVPA